MLNICLFHFVPFQLCSEQTLLIEYDLLPHGAYIALVTSSKRLDSSKIGPNQTVATPPRQSASASTPHRHLIKELSGLTRFFSFFQDLYNDLSLHQPWMFSANLDGIPANTED